MRIEEGGRNMVDKYDDPRELYQAAVAEYDVVEKLFFEFRNSLEKHHRDVLNYFIHDARGAHGNLRYALKNNELPVRGKPDLRWKDYNSTRANIGLMRLILELRST